MGFFIETLIGGLMAGMLYSLVALGFVLIFKASSVFNFAQGAMVLFAALAMARFSEWFPIWFGFDNLFLANLLAFLAAGALMFLMAWLIERLVLRHLVNQEGATLLMATLGISYFVDGLGQSIFGSDIYQIDIGMPRHGHLRNHRVVMRIECGQCLTRDGINKFTIDKQLVSDGRFQTHRLLDVRQIHNRP